MLRAVIDTNTWLSGLIWGGSPRQLIEHVLNGDLQGLSSPALALEFARVLGYPRIETALRKRGLSSNELSNQFELLNQVVETPSLVLRVSRDPDDDAVLACAQTAQADLIVSGDQDLLVLQRFAGIPILTAAQALEQLKI